MWKSAGLLSWAGCGGGGRAGSCMQTQETKRWVRRQQEAHQGRQGRGGQAYTHSRVGALLHRALGAAASMMTTITNSAGPTNPARVLVTVGAVHTPPPPPTHTPLPPSHLQRRVHAGLHEEDVVGAGEVDADGARAHAQQEHGGSRVALEGLDGLRALLGGHVACGVGRGRRRAGVCGSIWGRWGGGRHAAGGAAANTPGAMPKPVCVMWVMPCWAQ